MEGRRLVPAVMVALCAVAACSSGKPDDLGSTSPAPEPSTLTAEPSSPSPTARGPGGPHVVGIVARNLQVPWGVPFLPDGTPLVGQRDTTRVVAITHKRVRTVGHVAGVHPQGQA